MHLTLISKHLTAYALVVICMITLPLLAVPNIAAAGGGGRVVFDPTNFAENRLASISAAASAISDQLSASTLLSLGIKEYTLDGVATGIANILIKQMSASIVNWINSGFEGSPAFVTDLDGFLLDVADKELGRIIYGTDLGFLCAPFELDIRNAIALKYRGFQEEIVCRVSDIVNNLDGFIDGDFSQGGWDGWYSLTIDDNPYNRYLQVETETEIRLRNAQGRELELLRWGSGFMSWKNCTTRQSGATPGSARAAQDVGIQDCTIVTPGSFIEKQLNDAVGAGQNRLMVADEINEIIGALFAQMLTQVFSSGGGGVYGLSQSYNGNPSYTSQLFAEGEQDVLTGAQQGFGGVGSNYTRTEVDYQTHKRTSLQSVTAAENRLYELQSCYYRRIETEPPGVRLDAYAFALRSASTTLAQQVTPLKSRLLLEINDSETKLTRANEIITSAFSGSDKESLEKSTERLNQLQNELDLHTISDAVAAEREVTQIQGQMTALNQITQQQLTSCQSGSLIDASAGGGDGGPGAGGAGDSGNSGDGGDSGDGGGGSSGGGDGPGGGV